LGFQKEEATRLLAEVDQAIEKKRAIREKLMSEILTRIRRLLKTGAAKCAKAACCVGSGWACRLKTRPYSSQTQELLGFGQ
jgi:hypothetical protein